MTGNKSTATDPCWIIALYVAKSSVSDLMQLLTTISALPMLQLDSTVR